MSTRREPARSAWYEWIMSLKAYRDGLLDRLRRGSKVTEPEPLMCVEPDEKLHSDPDDAPPLEDVSLTDAELIVQWAESQWARHIEEPSEPGEVEAISEYILDGAAWPTADILTWKVGAAYRDGGARDQDSFAWCGAFAAAAVKQLGISDDGRKQMVSPERLYANHKSRKVRLGDIQPGDVVVVGDKKKRKHGSHITVCVGLRGDGLIDTIEGNAIGLLPDGSIGEGVIKRTRPLPPGSTGGPRDPDPCPVTGRPQNARVISAYRFERVEV